MRFASCWVLTLMRSPLLGKGNRVGDQVDEDLSQPPLHPRDLERLVVEERHQSRTGILRNLEVEFDQVRQKLVQVEDGHLVAHQFRIEAAGVGDIGHQPVEPVHVLADHIDQALPVVVGLGIGHGVDGGTQRGQRVLDLVRDIRGKGLVGLDPVVKRLGHQAHGFAEVADLVGARGHVGNVDTFQG